MSDLVPPMMPDDLDALIQAMERVQQLEAEVASLRLTDEEREAISAAACICEDAGRTDIAVIINTALERLG
jgi:hypothetical protein